MKVSCNWLQTYFDVKLPPPEKVGEALTFAGFELEEIEEKNSDAVLDIKVLADRACYALSHRGIAHEVSAALHIPLKEYSKKPITESHIEDPNIGIDEPKLCTKFVARRIENVKVGPSPEWLRERLEVIGQRSINNIVDITNFVMFDIGRPSHAFDADKVKGKLTVRRAQKGELVVTLDDKRVELRNDELVMADDEGPVGLAGIKGGKRTEIDANTKNIILEAANWNPSYIRLTATATGIKTDASRRFENRISPLLGEEGIDAVTRLIAEIASTPKTKIGKRIALSFEKPVQRTLAVNPKRISQKLGIPISEEAATEALARLGIICEKASDGLVATIPYERLDLSIPEDVAEEIARNIGYVMIPAVLPPRNKGMVHTPKEFYFQWKIRETLAALGFSEIMTSSFGETGDIAIEKPLAEDKKYARPNLRNNFEKALKMNALNVPLVGGDDIRIFEIGKVFPHTGEYSELALGLKHFKKQERNESYVLESLVQILEEELGVEISSRVKASRHYGAVFEVNLDELFAKLPEPTKWDISIPTPKAEKFTSFSVFPFIVRDVALFVLPETKPESVAKVLGENAGSLVVRGPELFDEFSKDGKKSLAFRLVFQSFDRTLSDEEANKAMEKVYSSLKVNGWEVR